MLRPGRALGTIRPGALGEDFAPEGSIGDTINSYIGSGVELYGGWMIAIPAVALAWGLLSGKDRAVRKFKRYRRRRARAGK